MYGYYEHMNIQLFSRVMLACGLATLVLALPMICRADPPARASGDWQYYKSRFIQDDGRVIDYMNKQMSHSEGQSFTMYLALAFDEQELFDKVWTWTRDNLMVSQAEGLAAWSWGSRGDGSWGLLDANDATDGDIFLAWTLLRAGERWKRKDYLEASGRIASAIQAKLTASIDGKAVLLPGREGFVKPGQIVFNPSYFIFPAFHDLARAGDASFWRGLHASCLDLVGRSLAGPLRLPPDWVASTGQAFAPWSERGAFFSYDAIRVPLYLSWDLDRNALEGFSNLIELFRKNGELPARFAVSDAAQNQGQAPAGFYAVLARTAETLGQGPEATALWEKADALLPGEKDDYYSHVLYLMSTTRGLP